MLNLPSQAAAAVNHAMSFAVTYVRSVTVLGDGHGSSASQVDKELLVSMP